MSRSLNRVELLGYLSSDSEIKFTQGGTSITKFTVVTNRRWKDKKADEYKDEANFTNCIQWAAENIANYLVKGKRVWCAGRLQNRSYEKDGSKRYVTEVVIEELILLDGGDKGNTAPRESRQQPAGQQKPEASNDGWGGDGWSDDIAFGNATADDENIPF